MKKTVVLLMVFFYALLSLKAQKHLPFVDIKVDKSVNAKNQVILKGYQTGANGSRSITELTFEGIGNFESVSGFYNGDTSSLGIIGPTYGIQFNDAMVSLIDMDNGGSGNFANEPSDSTALGFYYSDYYVDTSLAINVPYGFQTGFSAYYSVYAYPLTISIYDGENGTGNLLATVNLLPNAHYNCSGDPSGYYCNWDYVSIPFNGTAKSVVFSGKILFSVFDNLAFDSINPAPSVPVSTWAILISLFLIVVYMLFIYQKRIAL